MKLRRRNDMAAGARSVRGCIREECPADSLNVHIPQLSCLVCSPRHPGRRPPLSNVERRGSPNGCPGIRPDVRLGRFGQIARRGKLRTRAIRRGATRTITQAGGSFTQILKAGRWYPSADKLFLVLGQVGARATASLLIGVLEDEAPEWN